MSKITLKSYYAVILSVGYGVYNDWDKIKALQDKGFHKRGSRFFQTKKFENYYAAAQYALQTAVDRCKMDGISVSNFVIPTVPNQLFFYSSMNCLNPEEEASLRQIVACYHNGMDITNSAQCAPIDLVEFADGLTDC